MYSATDCDQHEKHDDIGPMDKAPLEKDSATDCAQHEKHDDIYIGPMDKVSMEKDSATVKEPAGQNTSGCGWSSQPRNQQGKGPVDGLVSRWTATVDQRNRRPTLRTAPNTRNTYTTR